MIIKRCKDNPVLKPDNKRFWEAQAVFNGCPVKKDSKTYLLYRAISLPYFDTPADKRMEISSIGIADSNDGIHFKNRKRFIMPEKEWEKYGCEDPRITKLNNKYYIFYTALSTHPFSAQGIKVGLAVSKDLKTIEERHLITPFNAKGFALFPEKIEGKYWAILTVHTDMPPAKICLISFDKEEEMWDEDYWKKWYEDYDSHSLGLQRKPQDHIEVGAPPIKTKEGWLLFYSYIRNYLSNERFFGVEVVLLDLKNPSKIVARLEMPILGPHEYYERIGMVPNVVFPSGAVKNKDLIHLYYGAADTTCCRADIRESYLLNYMLRKGPKIKFKRFKNNPIITPKEENSWETLATFNPAAVRINDKVHILYRAMSDDNTSVLGYAISKNGKKIDYRSDKPAYVPRKSFEEKKNPGGNSGCEDPRLTIIGDKVYMFYTAYDGVNSPRVSFTWIKKNDFLKQKWDEWVEPKIISPPNMDDKDACLFPEKIDNNYYIIHRTGDDMDLAVVPDLEFGENEWIEDLIWIKPRNGWWDSKKVGVAAPPLKIDDNWLILYHGVSEKSIYRVGAVLVSGKDPFNILARTYEPLFEPEESYEKKGIVSNVVFPCGAVIIDDELLLYYGGGDKVTGVASIKVNDLFKKLKNKRI